MSYVSPPDGGPLDPYSGNKSTSTGKTIVYGDPMKGDQWHSGICECTTNCDQFCLACWCPCIQFGINQNDAFDISSFGMCLSYAILCGCFYIPAAILGGCQRTKFRRQYNIEGRSCDDFCAYMFCCACAMAQESREINIRSGLIRVTSKDNDDTAKMIKDDRKGRASSKSSRPSDNDTAEAIRRAAEFNVIQ